MSVELGSIAGMKDAADDWWEFNDFERLRPGDLDIRVFDQDQWWVDVHGTPHLLAEMATDYRLNLIVFLREHATSLHVAATRMS